MQRLMRPKTEMDATTMASAEPRTLEAAFIAQPTRSNCCRRRVQRSARAALTAKHSPC